MTPPRIWQKGDRVVLGYLDRTITARVELASPNGASLMIAFDALLGGYVGHMPLRWDESAGEYRCLIRGLPALLAEPDAGRLRA